MDLLKCDKCGKELKEDSRFCNNCGNEIRRNYQFCTNCGNKLNTNHKYCNNCGTINSNYNLSNKNLEHQNNQPSIDANNENTIIVSLEDNNNQLLENQKENTSQDSSNNKPLKKQKKHKILWIVLFIIFVLFIILIAVSNIEKDDTKDNNSALEREKRAEKECKEFTERLQVFIDNKDYEGFDSGWSKHGDLTTDSCTTISCSCPSAWALHIERNILHSQDYLNQGLISSAYEALHISYTTDESGTLQNFHDSNHIFKILSTEQKTEITGVYYGGWNWKYQVGGSFKFNKRYVHYGSSTLRLTFNDYFDKVLISGHMASSKHPNWNYEKTISVNWYNYKILNNIIYVKLESETEYDALFEIVSLTDAELQLKLLINTTDVNAGQIYIMNYNRQ